MNAIEQQIAAVMPDIFQDAGIAGPREHVDADGVIPEGQRNDALSRMAGSMRRKAFSVDAIAAALRVENARLCAVPLPEHEVQQIARSVGRYQPADTGRQAPPLLGLTLAELSAHTFPARKAIFTRGDTVVFREGHIGQVYAERGFGKTWFLQSLALAASAGAEALGFRTPEPLRVLNLDGEMASEEIKERYGELSERLSIPMDTSMLTVVAADWQEQFLPRLDTDEGQRAIEPFVEAADLIILDNRSCLFDPEGEKDPSAWQPAQDYLLSLRRRGKAVLLGHHSNRQGGARGHSKAEDPMNLLIKLSRPEDYSQDQGARFVATFEKSRGAYGAGVGPFSAHLTADGWRCDSVLQSSRDTTADKLLEYVRLADQAGEPVKSANAAIIGAKVNRNNGLTAWATLLGNASILKRQDGTFYAK